MRLELQNNPEIVITLSMLEVINLERLLNATKEVPLGEDVIKLRKVLLMSIGAQAKDMGTPNGD